MKTFEQYLEEQLQDPEYAELHHDSQLNFEISSFLLYYRSEHEISQEVLAWQLGISPRKLAKIENMDADLKISEIIDIFKTLDYSVNISFDKRS